MQRTIRLIIEYDGTNYVGWQIQHNGIAVQQRIQDALRKMTGEEVVLIGASRTDAGVHALGQVASFRTTSLIPLLGFVRGLTGMLPCDIVIKAAEEVDADFHAQRSACGKIYRYLIWNNTQPTALDRWRMWHVARPLDVAAMRKAARTFVGKHNFRSFMGPRTAVKSTTRRIKRLTIVSKNHDGGRTMTITFEGDGFLRSQIRNMVGTLVEVGEGKRAVADIKKILAAKDRRAAGFCAPAHGLYLVRVIY